MGRLPAFERAAVLGRLQRGAGNASTTRLLEEGSSSFDEAAGRGGVGGLLARQPLAGQLDAATGAHTAAQSLSADVTIAANQTLPSPAGKTIHTGDATHVNVSATTTGLSISFDPYLIITKHDPRWYVPDVDIWVHHASWSFATQTLEVEWTARNAVNWLGDPGGEMLAAMQHAISGLPSRMFASGYNPYEDPDLPADLASFAARLGSTAGPGVTLPDMSSASITGSFSVVDELTRPAGDSVSIVLPAGSNVSVTASLSGIPQSAADLRIASLQLSLTQAARINLRALGQDWPVISLTGVTVTSGHISADYRIIHEDIGTALLGLLAAAQVEADPLSAGRIRDDLTVRDQAAHQKIDQMMRDQLEPLLHDLIVHNTGAIPGLNLQEALGIQAAAAPTPAP